MKSLLSLTLVPLLMVLLIVTGTEAFANGLDELAIQDRGRKKPFTTFAQETTLLLTGQQTVTLPEEKRTLSADDFILALWFAPEGWDAKPVILVDYLPLRRALGLPVEEKRFSYRQLAASEELKNLKEATDRKLQIDPQGGRTRQEREVDQVVNRLSVFASLASGSAFTVVPHPSSPTGGWKTLDLIGDDYPKEAGMGVIAEFALMARAQAQGDAKGIDTAAAGMAERLRELSPAVYPPARRLAFESFYIRLHPWRWAWVCYGLAALVLALTGGWRQALGYRIGWALALGGFGFQLWGFVSRMIIAGRPPVTNMYESIIWVSFAAVLFSLILEAIYRPRIFLQASMPLALVALMVVDFQPLIFDSSIQPLVPVLRNNFWLAIHVMTITLSYGAYALAMGLGHIVLWKIMRGATAKETAMLLQYIYRAIQIGVLLLATGTILGAVWANYSWGRFWDWDPKETWALITLLCYLALLHGRFAGWWSGFALAVGSIVCFLSVLMAWYGVNFVLGKGLHSYGFGTGGTGYVVGFVVFEVLYVGFAIWQRRQRVRTAAALS